MIVMWYLKKKIEILIYIRFVSIIVYLKMFNPEFRYLLVQEERNGEMMPFIDPHVFSAIFICGTNGIVLCAIGWIVYKLFGYYGRTAKYLWVALWNSLTPGHEWFDLVLILSTLITGIVMFFALKGMGDVLDKGFIKLKHEINKKDERIRELEAKIASLEATRTSEDDKPTLNKQVETEEEEAKRLDKWFSRTS